MGGITVTLWQPSHTAGIQYFVSHPCWDSLGWHSKEIMSLLPKKGPNPILSPKSMLHQFCNMVSRDSLILRVPVLLWDIKLRWKLNCKMTPCWESDNCPVYFSYYHAHSSYLNFFSSFIKLFKPHYFSCVIIFQYLWLEHSIPEWCDPCNHIFLQRCLHLN